MPGQLQEARGKHGEGLREAVVAGLIVASLMVVGTGAGEAQTAPWLPSPGQHALKTGKVLPPDRDSELLLASGGGVELAAGAGEAVWSFVIPVSGVEGVAQVEALQIRFDGVEGIVRHGVVRVDVSGEGKRRAERENGFAFAGAPDFAGTLKPYGLLGAWAPWAPFQDYPEGVRWRIHDEADLIVTLMVQAGEEAVLVAPKVALWLTTEGGAEVAGEGMPLVLRLANEAIRVPPGSEDYSARDLFVLPVAARVYGLYPSGNRVARTIRLDVLAPPEASGEEVTADRVFEIASWEPGGQQFYWFETPIDVPAGSRFDLQIRYENAPPRVPEPVEVRWGTGAGDETGEVYVVLAAGDEAGTLQLAQSLGRHQLLLSIEGAEADPEESVGRHARLARLYADLGKYETAVSHGRKAVAVDEESAEAHSALGAAFVSEDFHYSAQDHLEKAVRLDPEDASAWYNLGNIFYHYRVRERAWECYQKAGELVPRDNRVANNLGLIRMSEGDFAVAREVFGGILKRDPFHPAATANLGRCEEQDGNLAEAKVLYERALRLSPGMGVMLQPLLSRLETKMESP